MMLGVNIKAPHVVMDQYNAGMVAILGDNDRIVICTVAHVPALIKELMRVLPANGEA